MFDNENLKRLTITTGLCIDVCNSSSSHQFLRLQVAITCAMIRMRVRCHRKGDPLSCRIGPGPTRRPTRGPPRQITAARIPVTATRPVMAAQPFKATRRPVTAARGYYKVLKHFAPETPKRVHRRARAKIYARKKARASRTNHFFLKNDHFFLKMTSFF